MKTALVLLAVCVLIVAALMFEGVYFFKRYKRNRSKQTPAWAQQLFGDSAFEIGRSLTEVAQSDDNMKTTAKALSYVMASSMRLAGIRAVTPDRVEWLLLSFNEPKRRAVRIAGNIKDGLSVIAVAALSEAIKDRGSDCVIRLVNCSMNKDRIVLTWQMISDGERVILHTQVTDISGVLDLAMSEGDF